MDKWVAIGREVFADLDQIAVGRHSRLRESEKKGEGKTGEHEIDFEKKSCSDERSAILPLCQTNKKPRRSGAFLSQPA
ncbi:hypothetical protein DA792_05475 [Celeribacter baekdonensis]|uniref:Uncharacterized protein n=1 Tax=Celeribacter baekdonensis TaxID=875171 RepID=A0A2R4M0G7_9RHOB|nr:hypothetical protein DA792_05475 [Celeribacter baekdonensis]